jgi:hypothetical protein
MTEKLLCVGSIGVLRYRICRSRYGVGRYKQAGNCVPPPLARALGAAVREAAAIAELVTPLLH